MQVFNIDRIILKYYCAAGFEGIQLKIWQDRDLLMVNLPCNFHPTQPKNELVRAV